MSDLSLPSELSSWLDTGFVQKDGYTFLIALAKSRPSNKHIFDKTGVECFVNSFHIDDYVSERYLDHACLFCNSLLRKWAMKKNDQKLNVIISTDDFGAVIKFHIKRQDEHWLNYDLESYNEPVLETDKLIDNYF